MKNLKLFLVGVMLVSGLNAYNYDTNAEYKECKPCKNGKIIGATGGSIIGGSMAYSACVAAAIAAGTLTAGAGFAAGMAVCGGATAIGALEGGALGGTAGDGVDDVVECCEE